MALNRHQNTDLPVPVNLGKPVPVTEQFKRFIGSKGTRVGAMVVFLLETPEWTSEPAPERWAALPLVSSHGWTTKQLNSNDARPSTDDMYSWILNGPAPPYESEDVEG